jgi:hypothetical protein
MDAMTQAEPGSWHVLRKLAALALVIAAIGLPVNTLSAFGLLAACVLIVFTGSIERRGARWLGALAVAALVLAVHLLLPAPRIEEGHNAILIDKPGGALERGLPREVFRRMAEQFAATYPADKSCHEGDFGCWGFHGLKDDTFAFAAGGMFDRGAFSRRVRAIDFDNPVWLRLGFVNDLATNFFGKPGRAGAPATRPPLARDLRALAADHAVVRHVPLSGRLRRQPPLLARRGPLGGRKRAVRAARQQGLRLPHPDVPGHRQARFRHLDRPHGKSRDVAPDHVRP